VSRKAGGFALILVIWSLVLLTTLATGFAYAVRYETRAAGDVAALARAEAASAAAVRYAVLALTADDPATRWQADAREHILPWSEAEVSVKIRSSEALIDMNRAPRAFLAGLFAALLPDADPDALADAVLDWRDPNDRSEPAGGESAAYLQAGFAYTPANRPFTSVHELRRVLGFSSEIFAAVAPYLTVHGRGNQIHAPSATANVLAAIPGIRRSDADAFIAERAEALANGEPLDYDSLRSGQRFLLTAASSGPYVLEITVKLPDGIVHREHRTITLASPEGPVTLAWDTIPPSESDGIPTP
jgi:general secretion pathway protein K